MPGNPKIKYALVTFFLVVAPFLVPEGIARLYFMKKDIAFSERQVAYKYLPYLGYVYQPFIEARNKLYTDRHGFIHNGYDKDRDLRHKPEDEFRIFILGGSSAAGTYVNGPEDTIASKLEKRLAEIFERAGVSRKPHVINTGISGYFSAQELMLSHFVISKLKPNYLIYFDGANDCHFNIFIKSSPFNPTNSPEVFWLLENNFNPYSEKFFESYDNMFTISGVLTQFAKLLINYSAAVRFVLEKHYVPYVNKLDKEIFRGELFLRTGKLDIPIDKYEQFMTRYDADSSLSEKLFELNLRTAVSMTLAHPYAVAYFVQPGFFHDTPASTAESGKIGKVGEAKKQCFTGLARVKRDVGENPKIRMHDLSALFDGKSPEETLFGDSVHYTNLGRDRIVDAFVNAIGNHILETARR